MRGRPMLLSMCLSMSAWAGVDIAFVQPERYTDAGFGAVETQRTTAEIAGHLEKLGKRYLQPEQNLRIEVLDIDLAGRVRAGSPGDLRVMRGGADWPRIRLRYTLESPGQAPRSGEEAISDQDYLRKLPASSESLAHEKRMLDEWFRDRFKRSR